MHDPQDKPTPNPERIIKSLFLIFFSLFVYTKLKGIVECTKFYQRDMDVRSLLDL